MDANSIKEFKPLVELLEEITDKRRKQGQRYTLKSILLLNIVAMICGNNTYQEISEWGKNYKECIEKLGFKEKTPCAATIYNVLSGMEIKMLEKKLDDWVEQIISVAKEKLAIAIDGKTMKASKRKGMAKAHVISAVVHRLGLLWKKMTVQDSISEKIAMIDFLESITLKGTILTMDALHTDREVAEKIVSQEADYVMVVKDNQPSLKEEITTLFDDNSLSFDSAETIDKGHGRIEHRKIVVSSLLQDYSSWPGAKQVFCITRSRTVVKTAKTSIESVYGVTSLSSDIASPAYLLSLNRNHWHIENKSHWVRDVIFDEDRSSLSSNISLAILTFRNFVINLFRLASVKNISSQRRFFLAHPFDAIDFLINFKI